MWSVLLLEDKYIPEKWKQIQSIMSHNQDSLLFVPKILFI